jgi:hypothetical protein
MEFEMSPDDFVIGARQHDTEFVQWHRLLPKNHLGPCAPV